MFLGVHVFGSSEACSVGKMTSSTVSEGAEPDPGQSLPQSCGLITADSLASIIREGNDKMLVIDSRSFLEYNTSHAKDAINICCSKLVKRRLQHDKVMVKDLLAQTCHLDPEEYFDIIVYDQCSMSVNLLSHDCFLSVLLNKLVKVFHRVYLLQGGFLNFQASHTSLCESKAACSSVGGNYKTTPLTSMSQPCMPVSNLGPTKILPFLYLGSQQDALSQDTTKQNGVNYILNVSTTCPKPKYIKDSHFHRIPVNDNYCDKLLPYFNEAFQFIDKVKEANGCVLVHCLAGISRSPTVAIAYVMKHLGTTSEEAYKYVKDKRPTISPNFNFLGQLMEYEKQSKLNSQQPDGSTVPPSNAGAGGLSNSGLTATSFMLGGNKEPAVSTFASGLMGRGMKKSFSLHLTPNRESPVVVHSPTTALAKLNFNSPSPISEVPMETPQSGASHLNFPQFPTTSLDKLSFMPCFAKEQTVTAGAANSSRTRHPSGNNNNISKSPGVAGGGGGGGGTKRPLSTNDMDTPPLSCSPCSSSQVPSASDHGNKSGTISQVMCRSPESRAKRPLVRPNSIAFSTYPKFDFSMDSAQSSVTSPSGPLLRSPSTADPNVRSRSSTPDRSKDQPKPSQKSPTPAAAADSVLYIEGRAIQMRNKENASGASTGGNLARKSQSLEDILNSQEEEEAADWMGTGSSRGKRGKHLHRTLHAAELFSQPVALDRVQGRCRGPSDLHQSSSNTSISSSGSHNSLQGSLELIPVS